MLDAIIEERGDLTRASSGRMNISLFHRRKRLSTVVAQIICECP